ncbi:hypothetical protein OsJ_14968 [Oryza sativa Japonica Group]|jgi:hypothetical protein|uniref:Uncharacterized protein n=1 Tax=Oryza sativa subsp. japonica TaxID=39947 RepID=A3AUA4_ORYSJ|nr:hypothetical protein OsJ_14968 [Oryza sativa Japonica Group]
MPVATTIMTTYGGALQGDVEAENVESAHEEMRTISYKAWARFLPPKLVDLGNGVTEQRRLVHLEHVGHHNTTTSLVRELEEG